MKKRIFALIFITISALLLFSCRQNNSGNGGGEDENVIFSADVQVGIVSLASDSNEEIDTAIALLADAIAEKTAKRPTVADDASLEREHEIALGDTARDISTKAKKKLLDAIKKADPEELDEGDSYIGYAVYSNGTSAAVVWTDDMLAAEAIVYFADNYVIADTLKLSKDYVKTLVFSRSDYIAEMREKEVADAWKALSDELSGVERGDEIVEALRAIHNLYTPEMVLWVANLYDPEIGGFYHSNSARNNEGYLPDIGSTWTALSFMAGTGMVDSWGDATPLWMREQIGEFVYSLQSEDGYFYHPQWGSEISNDKREEHLKAAKSMLSAFGIEPKYSYPGAVSAAALTGRLSESKVTAVSSVVPVDAKLPQYASETAYRDWLDGWYERISAGKTTFYSFGDELQSQVSNIKMYGKALGVDLMKITTDFLTSHQKDNGLWDDELNYTATNAVHKIASVYNSAGCEIPNADKIIEAGIEIISSDTPISACVDLYNAWSCISYIIKNVREYAYGTEYDRNQRADSIIASAREIAPEAILGSLEKIGKFRKDDGSFSYGPVYASAGGGGMALSVPLTIEGDLGGNSICVTSLMNEIYASLGIENRVPIFTYADYLVFMDTLEGLGEIVKDPIRDESIIIDFEECSDDQDIPTELNASQNSGRIEIATEDDGNKYLEITTEALTSPNNQPSLDISANRLSSSPGYAVIEMDIEYLDGHGTVGNQLMLYGASSIIMQLSVSTQSGEVVVKNSADSNKALATAPMNERFKLRIEYFWNEGYAAIYLNDDTLPSGITTELYPDKGAHQSFTKLHFGGARAQAGVTLIDNIRVEVRAAKSDQSTPELKPKESVIYGFESSNIGDTSVPPLTVSQGSEGSAKVAGDEDGKYLELTNVATESGSNPSVRLYSNDLKETVNKAVIQMDLKFVSAKGGVMYIYGTNKFITQFNFGTAVSGDVRYVILKNPADSKELVRVPADDWFTLRIEYFWDAGYFAFYVNGSEEPVSYASTLPDSSKGHSKFDYVHLGASRGENGVTLVDNIIAETLFVDEIPEMPKPAAPKNPDIIDFDNVAPASGMSPSDISPKLSAWGSGSVSVVEKSEGNNALDIGTSSVWLYPTAKTPEGVSANATVVEFTVNYSDSSVASDAFYWRYTGSNDSKTQINIKSNAIRVYKADGSNSGWISLVNSDGSATKDGDDITLRFEYLWSGYLNVYSNGVLIIDKLEVTPFAAAFQRLGVYSSKNLRTYDDIYVINTSIE